MIKLMINHENRHSIPSYLVIKDEKMIVEIKFIEIIGANI